MASVRLNAASQVRFEETTVAHERRSCAHGTPARALRARLERLLQRGRASKGPGSGRDVDPTRRSRSGEYRLSRPESTRVGRTPPTVVASCPRCARSYATRWTLNVTAMYRRATFGLSRATASGIAFVSNALRTSTAFIRYRGDSIVIAHGIDLARSRRGLSDWGERRDPARGSAGLITRAGLPPRTQWPSTKHRVTTAPAPTIVWSPELAEAAFGPPDDVLAAFAIEAFLLGVVHDHEPAGGTAHSPSMRLRLRADREAPAHAPKVTHGIIR